jgi:hypothetical protein
MDPKPSVVSEAPVSQEPAKPVKDKKPRTEAQQAATAKALAAMTAKRKEIIEKKKEVKEKVKQAKKVVEDKIIKEDLAFATRTDVDSLRKELAELRALHAVAKEREAEKPKPERIVERIVERHAPTPHVAAPQKLSGHALLDSIFFNK